MYQTAFTRFLSWHTNRGGPRKGIWEPAFLERGRRGIVLQKTVFFNVFLMKGFENCPFGSSLELTTGTRIEIRFT